MNRVVVLGPSGAGKTELALRLSERTGIPVVHLDRIFWAPDWQPASPDEAAAELAGALEGERWIVDGNFLGDDDRFARADTVIFLDLPRRLCIRRILWRRLRDRGRDRVDLPEGCRESIDLALLRWVWGYNRTDRPRVLALLERLGPEVDLRHARSNAEVAAIVRGDG